MRELGGASRDLNDLKPELDADIDEEEYKRLAEHLGEVAENSKDFSHELKYNQKAAQKNAEAILRFDKSIEKVNENYEDWNHTLKSGSLQDQSEMVGELGDAYADMLDIDVGSLSEDFILNTDNLELMKKAAEGSEEAYNQLQEAAGKDILAQIGLDTSQYETDLLNVESMAADVNGNKLADIEAGASLDDTDFLNSLTNMVNEAGMTAQEATDYLASMGIDAEVVTDEETATDTQNIRTISPRIEWEPHSFNLPDWMGGPVSVNLPKFKLLGEAPTPVDSEKSMTAMGLKVKSATKSSGGNIKHKNSKSGGGTKGASGPKSSGGGGGGGSSSKATKKEYTKKTDVVKRYKEITDALDDIADAAEQANAETDRMYGDKRISAINKQINLLRQERELLKQKADAAKTYLKQDKTNLNKAANKAGIKFEYDDNNNITNYTEQMSILYDKLHAAEVKYNSFTTKEDQDAYYEKTLKPLEDQIKAVEDAMSQYEETAEESEEIAKATAENIRKELDLQLSGIDYSVEVQIEISDFDLKYLEKLLSRLNDDLTDAGERVKNMTSQMDTQLDNIEIYKTGIRETLVSAGADQATLDAYMSGDSTAVQGLDLTDEQMQMLTDYTEGIMEAEDAIYELRQEIEDQVMATFEAWHEEIERNGRAFEHASNMVQSYKDMVDIVGKDQLGLDDAILADMEATQIAAAKGAMENAKMQMETTKQALEQARQNANDTSLDEESRKMWAETAKQLDEQLMEDQEAFMTSWTDALQLAADNFESQMQRAFDNLEKGLTGVFGSFEALTTHMEQQETVSDRFLDQGEKIYELSKLNRKVQQDLSKTNNIKAQQELLKIQETINEYQKNGKEMSKYELEALQKKYDLRLAEIALEEAQNAKSTVRMSRNSEGGYSYVYVADEDKVASAQQNYEDKLEENRKLAEEQSASLTQAIVENNQAMVEAISEIRMQDYASVEEYEKAIYEITAYYKEQEAYLVGEYQKTIERGQDLYVNDYLAYEGWSTNKTNTAIALANGLSIIETEAGLSRQAYADELNAALQAKQDAANEIEYLKATGQWDKMSTEEQARYTKRLDDAQANWDSLIEKQSGAYGLMGTNSDGWVTGQGSLLSSLGYNTLNYVMYGADGESGAQGLAAALGDKDTEGTFFGDTHKAATTWQDSFSGIMAQAGIDVSAIKNGTNVLTGEDGADKAFTDFKTHVLEALYGKGGSKASPKDNSINGSVNAASSAIVTLGTNATTQFGNAATAVKDWQKDYSPKIKTATTDTKNLTTAISKLKKKNVEVMAKVKGKTDVDALATAINALKNKTVTVTSNVVTNYSTTGTPPSAGGGGTQGDGTPQIGDTVTFESGVYTADSYGGGTSGSQGRGGAMKISLITDKNRARPYHLTTTSGGARGWVSLSQISGYDTGGYTGQWGNEGKLAFLHQKELVLNKDDTTNFLTAMGILKEIVNTISLQSILPNLNNLTPNLSQQSLEQEVTIHAEFPNVNDHNEVEIALKNLINTASQYANRK